MEERSKTIMCSVLFLDIVEYSKKSVSGQISLKERFNAFLSVAIRDVPMDDRIILDTGDGAALSFLGDVEDALQVGLSLRESLRSEGAHMDPALLVRMGINLGPVRLVKDINNQPNIVGDGINVAQRIMAFSDPGQILVSRSYYDAVSRLSPEYADMFHYQGSRTDKHVREHEVYAIGYPGEFTSQQSVVSKPRKPPIKWGVLQQRLGKSVGNVVQRLSQSWRNAAQGLGKTALGIVDLLRKASPRQRAAYGGGLGAIVVAAIVITMLAQPTTPPDMHVATETPDGQPVPQTPATADGGKDAASIASAGQKAAEPEKSSSSQPTTRTSKPSSKPSSRPESKSVTRKPSSATETNIFGMTIPKKGDPGFVVVTCMEGSTVFVDGFTNGRVGKTPLRIPVDPGKHRLNITHTSKTSVYTGTITVKTGQTIRLNPGFCH